MVLIDCGSFLGSQVSKVCILVREAPFFLQPWDRRWDIQKEESLSLSLEGGGRRMPSNISKNPGALNCDKERKTQKHTQQCYALARMQDAVEMQYGMEAMHTIYSKGPMGRDG